MNPLREYQEKIRRYEDRGGPIQGHRGVRAHLDPVVNQELPPLGETLAIGIAEEALNLVEMLDREPGNRVLILERQRELRTQLNELVKADYR